MKTKIYYNPRCSKCRIGLKILKEKNEDIEIIKYLEEAPTKEDLKKILEILKIPAIDLIRQNEDIYKKLVKKNDKPNENQVIEWMIKHPKIIQRPIVIKNKKAIIGRPPEKILEIL
ncbi:arsenate reductase (glutaredoxin) [archaeon]|nr:arsenate reductase (glutaredoxin) [archaeon]MBT4648146.1 arsenate reductase (glutaredoxin) [archaeon]MBT6822436.1 arsenate reductase (glutaredoxin) [archaeon]MBT7391905.1 arsenate reductase (glutaredoxin) [archaeon]